MFTVIILASEDAKAMTRTLNALIGATVDGIVRDVVVLADKQNEIAAKVADFSGCRLDEPDRFSKNVLEAKNDWLLILEAGAFLEEGWVERVSDFTASGRNAARFARSPLAARSIWLSLFQAEQPLALGLLVKRNYALQLERSALTTPYELAKAIKPKAMAASLRPA